MATSLESPPAPAPASGPMTTPSSSTPRGIASAHLSPGSRTCIIVGSLDDVEEFDLSAFRAVLYFVTGASALPERFERPRTGVTVAAPAALDANRLERLLDDCIAQDSRRLPTVYLTNEALGIEGASYLTVVDAILAQCDSHHRARLARQGVGHLWQTNLLMNLAAYAAHPLPAAWAGRLAGLPAFVCGAGPSLDVSAAALARVAGHGVVFAADSALSALGRLGVRADIAVSIDATKTPQRCLPPGCQPPLRLVLASVSPPEWGDVVPSGQRCFASSNQITEDWVGELGIPKTGLRAQGNCGITAVELALHLGCSPIHLFGMDNAIEPDGRLHQRLYEDGETPRKRYPRVPGNYQPEVEAPFLREWRMLDARCATIAPGRIVNVTDRGARLQNTTLVHPDRLTVAAPGRAPAAAVEALPAAAGAPAANWRRVSAAIRATTAAAAPRIAAAAAAAARGDLTTGLQALAAAYRDPAFRQLMGNYSLKILPLLLEPNTVEPAMWRGLIEEHRQLVTLATELA